MTQEERRLTTEKGLEALSIDFTVAELEVFLRL